MAKRWRRRMGVMILCSMAGTTLMLALQGRIREAVPLHLCSVSALAAVALAFSRASPWIFFGCWHAGGGSGARVSPGCQPLADGVHGLLCADTRAHRAHRPERAGDGRTARVASRRCCPCRRWPLRRFLPTRARNGFSIPRRRSERRWRESIA
ncbi:MAG: hypothetical protein ACLUI3_07295 [Christensenellales bacterium]